VSRRISPTLRRRILVTTFGAAFGVAATIWLLMAVFAPDWGAEDLGRGNTPRGYVSAVGGGLAAWIAGMLWYWTCFRGTAYDDDTE
jgi:F0F1-type ATP synthase assembly protein I